MSDSLPPHGLQPARLLCPWNTAGKNTRVGCHALLQIFLTQGSNLGLWHCRWILYYLSYQWSYDTNRGQTNPLTKPQIEKAKITAIFIQYYYIPRKVKRNCWKTPANKEIPYGDRKQTDTYTNIKKQLEAEDTMKRLLLTTTITILRVTVNKRCSTVMWTTI